uniref:Fibronectin type-III domain-containing protein n=1 Tax=Amphimedon queenslandica TaxID=400682 RepID=A0A1X7UFE9_AMPQE
ILSEIDVNISRIDDCTVQLSWVPPFTLPGVPILGYNVNITNLDKNITTNSFINGTNIYFTLGYEYYVSIAAVNGAGEGNKTITKVNSTELLNFTEKFIINIVGLMRDQDKWKVDANIDVTTICGNADAKFVYKFCKSVTNAPCFNTTNITRIKLSNSQALLSTLLFLPEDQHYDVQVEAIVGKNVLSSSGASLSTFDVQSVEETDSPANGIICLLIHYVTGSVATGCQIKLDCDANITFLFHFDGYNDQFDKFQCTQELTFVGIKTCLLQVYDRIGQVNQNTSGPAVTSTINVTGKIATQSTPTTPNNNYTTRLAIAVVVPILVIILSFIIILITVSIIIRDFTKKRKGKFNLNSLYSNHVTPEKTCL